MEEPLMTDPDPDDPIRRCDVCHAPMQAGFVIDGGDAYYCSQPCLTTLIPWQDWQATYTDDGDSYYTEWESIYVDPS